MSELSQLSPQPLWDIFAKICSIPHPSYHEEQLAEHIMGWAKEKGLFAERDQVGNILIRKPATAGMENRKPVRHVHWLLPGLVLKRSLRQSMLGLAGKPPGEGQQQNIPFPWSKHPEKCTMGSGGSS